MIDLLARKGISKLVIKRADSRLGLDELLDRIGKINRKHGAVLQVFDRASIANRLHLEAAYANALSAFSDRTNRTNSIAMEMLLFAALTDQIEGAIDAVGAKEGSALVVFANGSRTFGRIRPMLKEIREFKPTMRHVGDTMKRLGVKYSKEPDIALLQKMALSRITD